MKNGTPSKLTLVDSAGHTLSDGEDVKDLEYTVPAARPALVFMAVSIACTVAAVAAGSYALWLTRQKAARGAINNVQDILKICQERMHQLEDDLNLLPTGLSTAAQ